MGFLQNIRIRIGLQKREVVWSDSPPPVRTHADDMKVKSIWTGMIARCYNPKSTGWRSYGKQGIKVCDEWREDFESFKEWAYANGWGYELTIDRVDGWGDYCPNNCRWITLEENLKRPQRPKKRPVK